MESQSNTIEHTLPHHLLQAREVLMAYLRPIFNHYGITEQQWRVLRLLHEQGDQEAGSIAEWTCILSPSLTGILVRMEKAGLVLRERDQNDSRRLIISISSYGKGLVNLIWPRLSSVYENIEAQFGKDNMFALVNLLQELKKIPNPGSKEP